MIEADFRIDYNGNILSSPDIERLKKEISDEYKKGYRSAAVVFMHSYRFNAFENRVFDLLKEAGFDYIYLSHRSAPVMKITARGDTACVDAYLTPVLKRYTDQFINELSGKHPAYKDQLLDKIFFMHSGGGLVKGEDFCGKESILSGPAGGIAGAVKACQLDNETDIISFDMGGTSTDVSHYRGEFERNYENEVAGVKIVYPMLDIHTVASGGGSIVGFDGEKFFAGPVSAGSDPGPACYRKNGPLTITDCNLFLGRIRAAYFPKVFGKASSQGPDIEAVKRKLAEIKADVFEKTQISMPEEEIAAGFLKIASEKMAAAIKKISLQKGRNPEYYVLCTFGGAGGQHACEIADILSIRKILVHPFSGVFRLRHWRFRQNKED